VPTTESQPLSPEDRAVIIEALAAALVESYNADLLVARGEQSSELDPAAAVAA
jgi:hypothetical protein